jgi:hypothetical protein
VLALLQYQRDSLVRNAAGIDDSEESGHWMAALARQHVVMDTAHENESHERTELIETMAKHRAFLRHTVQGLSDHQAAQRTTTSELCLGGIVKHVSLVEQQWGEFIQRGPAAIGMADEAAMEAHANSFRMLPGETLAGVLDAYERVARNTEALVTDLPSLEASHPLPEAPWFEPGARWSARRALLHILAETAQHAGHADIIRESLDGAKTMG